jgi:hypothetical protein
LNIEINLTSRAEVIDGVNIPANSIVINPNFSGEFGFEIQFTFTAEQLAEKGIDGNNVKLFHVDYDGNITDLGRLRLNADGSVEFTISHASYYILAEEAPTAPENDGNPTTIVTISFTAVFISGAALIISGKKQRKSIIRQ